MFVDGEENLGSFFDKANGIFEKVVNDNSWFPVESEIQSLAKYVWDKELRWKFEKLKNEVVNSRDSRLEQVGLTGAQLKFKMLVFNYFYGQWIIKKGIEWLKKLLNAINSILGSLIKGFHLAEPIKEFKDFLEICNEG